MGVVYHANYLAWCEVGRTEFIRAAGRSYAELEADCVMLAVSEMGIRFRAPARYDDVVRVLEEEGLSKFEDAWDGLIASVTDQLEQAGASVMDAGATTPAGDGPAAASPQATAR